MVDDADDLCLVQLLQGADEYLQLLVIVCWCLFGFFLSNLICLFCRFQKNALSGVHEMLTTPMTASAVIAAQN